MDIKATILILLNLVLIETLLAFPSVIATGVLLNKLQSTNKRKHLWLVILSTNLLHVLFLIFASWFIRVLFLEILIGGGMIYFAMEGLFLKRGGKVPVWKFYLIVLLIPLLSMLDFNQNDGVFAAVAFTNNIYLIIIGFLISMIAYYWLTRLFEKLSSKNNLIDLLGYLGLFVLGVEAVWMIIFNQYFRDPDHPEGTNGLNLSLLFFLLVVIILIIDRIKAARVYKG